LAAGDEAGALGLADLEEVLAGELDGGFVACGAGGGKIRVTEATGFVADDGSASSSAAWLVNSVVWT